MELNKKLEIVDLSYLGSGTYSVVRKARYNNEIVAIKIFNKKNDTSGDVEYLKEINELKRTSHPNIIKLIAAGKWQNKMDIFNCIIIEFADVGSLHQVLHETNYSYTLGHAISWLLQCANAVNYLHCRTPKPTIHRDLKPLNLLLMHGGVLLKICDFGTACDQKTIMSINKGSPCWISPEQLSSGNYNEKCDVYSFSVIAWEVMTRQKPYFHLNDPSSAQIMFGVIRGTHRPKRVANCPRILELLYERGMDGDPRKRPSMQLITDLMKQLDRLINKEPIKPICDSLPEINVQREKANYNSLSPNSTSLQNSDSMDHSFKSSHETVVMPKKNNITSIKMSSEMLNDKNYTEEDSDSGEQIARNQPGRLSFKVNPLLGLNVNSAKSHRRSKSYGNEQLANLKLNEAATDKSQNEKIKTELNHTIETMLYDPIEPLYHQNRSIIIFENHRKLIQEDERLQKNVNNLKQQIDQLNATINNIQVYNDLLKQKNLLINENANLNKMLH